MLILLRKVQFLAVRLITAGTFFVPETKKNPEWKMLFTTFTFWNRAIELAVVVHWKKVKPIPSA